jgi:hypothetical protein
MASSFLKGPHCLAVFRDFDWAVDLDDVQRSNLLRLILPLGALAMLTTKLYWLHMLFKELHVPLPTVLIIWCDNLGVVAIVSNSVCHARTKHIEVDYHFICKKVLNRDIYLGYGMQYVYLCNGSKVNRYYSLFRASPAIVASLASEKVQLTTLTITFLLHTSKYLFLLER